MGTSQSHSLKTTPQWSSAKRAMTGIIHNLDDLQRYSTFMEKFLYALGEDGLYYGSSSSGRHGGGRHSASSHKHAFGTAGSGVAVNLLNFVSDVRTTGLPQTISLLVQEGENPPQTPRDLINRLCTLSAKDTDANLDLDAALAAQRKLLTEIFKTCETLEDVEIVLMQADEDTIDAWIIQFEVEYIIEYQGSLFQSQIFDKEQEPDMVMVQIKRWLHSQLDSLLSDEMKHINLFSEDGKRYIDSLTSRILEIWRR